MNFRETLRSVRPLALLPAALLLLSIASSRTVSASAAEGEESLMNCSDRSTTNNETGWEHYFFHLNPGYCYQPSPNARHSAYRWDYCGMGQTTWSHYPCD